MTAKAKWQYINVIYLGLPFDIKFRLWIIIIVSFDGNLNYTFRIVVKRHLETQIIET
jgi:hypothetical protein